jgi:hypothetical protein
MEPDDAAPTVAVPDGVAAPPNPTPRIEPLMSKKIACARSEPLAVLLLV